MKGSFIYMAGEEAEPALDHRRLDGRREHLDKFVSLLLVGDDERDEGLGRAGLELGDAGGLLDLQADNVLAVDNLQELLDVRRLLRLHTCRSEKYD